MLLQTACYASHRGDVTPAQNDRGRALALHKSARATQGRPAVDLNRRVADRLEASLGALHFTVGHIFDALFT